MTPNVFFSTVKTFPGITTKKRTSKIKMRTSKIMKKNMSKMKKKTMPFMH